MYHTNITIKCTWCVSVLYICYRRQCYACVSAFGMWENYAVTCIANRNNVNTSNCGVRTIRQITLWEGPYSQYAWKTMLVNTRRYWCIDHILLVNSNSQSMIINIHVLWMLSGTTSSTRRCEDACPPVRACDNAWSRTRRRRPTYEEKPPRTSATFLQALCIARPQ